MSDPLSAPRLTFTVVVPAYNSAETLPAALDSVLSQTHLPAEVLVVDDGSTDATHDVAAAYGAPVRVLRKTNGGTASARNLAIAEAQADVIAFLDADDVYRPTHLADIEALLRTRPELAGAATDTEMRSPERIWRTGSFWPAHSRRDPIDVSSPIIFCSLGIRRDVLVRVGPFDGRFHILEDVEMFHRLLCNGHKIGYVDNPSYVYQVHTESKSQSESKRRGRRELFRINLWYALFHRTPLRFRPRLAVRAARHGWAVLRPSG